MAMLTRRPPRSLVLHTDHGVGYCATAFRRLSGDRGIVQSISRKRDCWDKARAETFFASLKTELVGERIFATREHARRELFEYIEVFCNRQRLPPAFLNMIKPRLTLWLQFNYLPMTAGNPADREGGEQWIHGLFRAAS